jgi:hypothetical protein
LFFGHAKNKIRCFQSKIPAVKQWNIGIYRQVDGRFSAYPSSSPHVRLITAQAAAPDFFNSIEEGIWQFLDTARHRFE